MVDNKEVVKMCICENCPSFKDCGKKEKGFCFNEPTKKCIKETNGCICGGCPVSSKFGLENVYYCIRGTEAKQNKKSK